MTDRSPSTQSGSTAKHDADCMRRKIDFPYLCTCALTDEQVEAARARPASTWQCEYCGRFYSERTAAAHGWCQQEQDRQNAESMWPA